MIDLKQLAKDNPNDAELGRVIREMVNKDYLTELKEEKAKREKKTREQKEQERVLKMFGKMVFPYDSVSFKQMFSNWIEYRRKEHGFKYKSEISMQGALKRIAELSNGNEDNAIQIISQSIENGWKGFFELKNKPNGGDSDYKQSILNDLLS